MVRAGTVEVRGGTVVSSWVTQPDGRIVDNLPLPSPDSARLKEQEGAVSASGSIFSILSDTVCDHDRGFWQNLAVSCMTTGELSPVH